MVRASFSIMSANLNIGYSKATLFLLSRFLKPRSTDNFLWSEGWKKALGAPPENIIKRLVDDEYLQKSDVYGKMECRFTANELKSLLTQKQLPTTGKKGALIQRLIDNDPNVMARAVEKLDILFCSDKGKQAAEDYLNRAGEERSRIGKQIILYLKERKFSEAYNLILTFESDQVFPREMGYDPKREIRILDSIFKHKPKLLKSITGPELEALRLYAASDFLWGSQVPPDLLCFDFKTNLNFDNETAARMLLFHARNRQTISDIKQMSTKTVEIIGAPNSCEECKKIAGKTYPIGDVIDLPYENCTNKLGCRCHIVPHF